MIHFISSDNTKILARRLFMEGTFQTPDTIEIYDRSPFPEIPAIKWNRCIQLKNNLFTFSWGISHFTTVEGKLNNQAYKFINF